MNKKLYNELLKKIDDLGCELERHKERECELLHLVGIERRYRHFCSRYITLSDCCSLIPFDIFDLSINGKLYHRGCTKEYLPKLLLNGFYGLYGFASYLPNSTYITDVRISLRESLVDLIVGE